MPSILAGRSSITGGESADLEDILVASLGKKGSIQRSESTVRISVALNVRGITMMQRALERSCRVGNLILRLRAARAPPVILE